MDGNQHYGGVIWTHHALERLKQRWLSQELALETFRNPDSTAPSNQGGTEYRKRYDQSLVTVIAKQNERHEWLIVSCWVDPPFPGTIDAKKKEDYLKYRKDFSKAGFWGKFWLEIKRQLFPKRY